MAILEGKLPPKGSVIGVEHDRLRRVQAEAEREEDQEVLPHLADHSRRRDVPAGAGAAVLRHRHAGGLRRFARRSTRPASAATAPNDGVADYGARLMSGAGLGDRLATTRTRSTGSSRKAFPTRSAVLPVQPGAAACCGGRSKTAKCELSDATEIATTALITEIAD